MKRFVLSNDNEIVIADTFTNALGLLFDFDAKPDNGTGEGPVIDETLAREANRLFEESVKAQRSGNWAEYGKLMNELESVLKEMLGQ